MFKKTLYLLLFILCMYVAAKYPALIIFCVEWIFNQIKSLFVYIIDIFKPVV